MQAQGRENVRWVRCDELQEIVELALCAFTESQAASGMNWLKITMYTGAARAVFLEECL